MTTWQVEILMGFTTAMSSFTKIAILSVLIIPHDACHVCGKGRIVSRPADTINKLPDNSPDQWQYLNRYPCQELQESSGFGMSCFESWTGVDFSPELIELFEENCGCEDQQACALSPPSHRLQYPRHFMSNYIVPGDCDGWAAPDSSNLPPSQWSHLPCGIVELRGTNRLIPSELCHKYQSMVKNDQACGGCVPVTPKLSTSPSSSPTSSTFSSVAIGIKNHGDNTNTNQKENSYYRGRFPATAWFVASLVAVAVVVVSRKRNNGPKEVTPEFELIGLRCHG